jgi:hypothetical protein
VDYMIHHLLSHSDTADWLKVNQFFVEQLAYIARKLAAIQEGEYTALDSTMILFCSSMLTGNHDASQLPVVLVGGTRRLRSGRVLNYRDKPDRQMCRLYLTMMDTMNLHLARFGDATEPLSEVRRVGDEQVDGLADAGAGLDVRDQPLTFLGDCHHDGDGTVQQPGHYLDECRAEQFHRA